MVQRCFAHRAAGAPARPQRLFRCYLLFSTGEEVRPELLHQSTDGLSGSEVIQRDAIAGVGRAVPRERFERFEVHLARLGEIRQILVAVDLLSSRCDARDRDLGRKIEEYDDVRQPDRAEAETSGQLIDGSRSLETRKPALGLWWYGRTFDDVREHRSQVFGTRRRFVAHIAGRAQVVRRASCGRQQSVTVANYYASAVTPGQCCCGDILRDHLRDLERRVKAAAIYQPFGLPLEPRGEARGDRQAVRVELRREMILIGIGDPERLSRRSRDEAQLSGQDGG